MPRAAKPVERLTQAQTLAKLKKTPAREAVYLLDRMETAVETIRKLWGAASERGKAMAGESMSAELKAIVRGK